MPKSADRVRATSSPAGAPTSSADAVGTEGDAGVEERGAFAIARCERCGWRGTARRSRERARKDLRHHLEDKPKHADHVSLEDVPR